LVNNEYVVSGIILAGVITALVLIPTFATDKVIFIDDTTTGSNFTDTTVCVNVGTGKLIVKSSTDGDCEIKSLIGSSDISITNDTNTITIDFNGTVSGESTQCINVGAGTIVIKNSTSGNCFVKTFIAGTGITITNSTDTITITNTITTLDSLSDVNSPSPSTGDILTFDTIVWKDWSIINLGLGATVYKGFDSTADQFQFRSLVQGSGINFVSGANDITISNTAQESTSCNNVGTGNQLCSGGNVNIDTLIAGNGITITDTTDDWTISAEKPFQLVGSVYSQLTKTNLPTTYTDIYTTAFHPENLIRINCLNVTRFYIIWQWDFVGAGTDQLRWVDASDNNNVLFERPTDSTDSDGKTTNAFDRPSWCTNTSENTLFFIEWQAKSSNGTNDPIAYGYSIYSR
jgi:hypothetical protein